MPRNQELAAWMAEHRYSAADLARALSDHLDQFGTGRRTSARHVRRWLSAQTRWPHADYRMALEAVAGMSAVELGFRPPGHEADPAPAESTSVNRRQFAGAAAVAAASLPNRRPTSLGRSDVERIRHRWLRLVQLDRSMGSDGLYRHANALAQQVLDLQESRSASQRVRSDLYALAAFCLNSAVWATVDAHDPPAAAAPLNRAVTVAGMSGNPWVQFETWRMVSMSADIDGRDQDAVAAAEAAMRTTAHRREPLYAAIAHARLAGTLNRLGARTRALRALDDADRCYQRVHPDRDERDIHYAWFDRAEVDGVIGSTMRHLGRPEEATHAYRRALDALRPDQQRNRNYYLSELALAQLAVDPDESARTAQQIQLAAPNGRIASQLAAVHSTLAAMHHPDAPALTTRERQQ